MTYSFPSIGFLIGLALLFARRPKGHLGACVTLSNNKYNFDPTTFITAGGVIGGDIIKDEFEDKL